MSPESGADRFYSYVARRILSCHAAPDLRQAVVLLPNYHVVQPLAQAISRAAALPALLLPHMTTLSDWAQTVELDVPVQSDTQRVTTLYQSLRQKGWFADSDLWSLSRELLALMDELTRHNVALPASREAFAQQLASAYQGRCGQAMQFEALVVHELWYAMSDDPDAAYQQRLGRLVEQVDMPVYVLLTCDLSAPEMLFLQACQARVDVTVFDLRVLTASEPDCALLNFALQPQTEDLRSAAARLSLCRDGYLNYPAPDSGRTIRLFGAHGLEQEAQAADVQVRRWLMEGRTSIAVVVQDRLVARRLRALLERAQVQVQDETGWTFATLTVSTVLMRWLDALQGDFYYQDVLDLLKSPLVFVDNPAMRKQAAYLFEQLVRKQGVIVHLHNFITLAERHAPELVVPLVRLRQAAQTMRGSANRTPKSEQGSVSLSTLHFPLSGWLHSLHESLEILGVIKGWYQDAAGQQLMQLLALWENELQSDNAVFSFSEWRRWLSQQLDLNTYRDLSVDSPVLFTHLAATRWRAFDAVLCLGCDAQHLPAPVNAGQWFNDAVRATLGLPLSGVKLSQVRDDLLSLLALNNTVQVSWQANQNGESNLLSPHFEMIRALHLQAFDHDLMDEALGELLDVAQVRIQDSECRIQDPAEMPRPVVPPELIPARISPSAYNALVACPYQYFARHVLHLNELDEVREALDKRDYGSWVHKVLQCFHRQIPVLLEHDAADAAQVLQRISVEVFADGLAHDYLAEAWLLRWQAKIPAYLTWQLENEHAGWRYQGSEVPFEINVDADLVLRGQLDRVDVYCTEADRLSVLDYKTQTVTVLKNKLKEPGEDVQLACYAQAVTAGAAAFVGLEDETILAVSPPEEIGVLAELTIDRLKTLFAQMRSGMPLPAQGADKICAYCEMKGVCRRGEWQENRMQDAGVGHG